MNLILPDGLFNGDRLRLCSNAAQLHWPRLFLMSDGFARLEINYARLIGRAYASFHPVPTESELEGFIQEYAENHLLFLYEANGMLWGQWDSPLELLPRYKTSHDRKSPIPPEPDITQWKTRYRQQKASFPKSFRKVSEKFQHVVAVAVAVVDAVVVGEEKHQCPPAPKNGTAGRVGALFSIEDPPFNTVEPEPADTKPVPGKKRATVAAKPGHGMTGEQSEWFATWWETYWRRVARAAARSAFAKHVRTPARFAEVMAATSRQTPEMLAREPDKRPHGATWLNQERWSDEPAPPQKRAPRTELERYLAEGTGDDR